MQKILLIEDDFAIIDNLAFVLRSQGYDVLTAKNGREGIEKALETIPDLIISDIMMPELDGFEVFKKLRSDSSTFSIPFLFLSARSDRLDVRHGMELGADDYITKPFKKDEVVSAVKIRLEKKEKIAQHFEERLNDLRLNITGIIPHEMRTPLNGIIGFSELLKHNWEQFTSEDQKGMVEQINISSKRLHRLITNYICYTSLMSFDEEKFVSPDPFCPSSHFTVFEQSQAIAMRYQRLDDLEIERIHDFPLNISEKYLMIVVEELVDNAFKFSMPGSKVVIKTTLLDSYLSINITNTGRKITPEQVSNIGAFVQFERHLYEQQGSGLGLAIVKRITELFKGSFSISSTDDEQTTATITYRVLDMEEMEC